MRIIIQHVGTSLYVQGPEMWTADPAQARDFGNSEAAVEFIQRHHLGGIRLLAAFVDGAWLQTVALPFHSPLPANSPELTRAMSG